MADETFVTSVKNLERLLSEVEQGKLKLHLTLKDVSHLHQLQNKLYNFKLLNSIYGDDSRIKQILSRQASCNWAAQEELCSAIEQEIEKFMKKYQQLDKLVLYILNTTLNHESMITILKVIGDVVLGTQSYAVYKQGDKLEYLSTVESVYQEEMFQQYRGDSAMVDHYEGRCVIRTLQSNKNNNLIIFDGTLDVLPIQRTQQLKQLVDQLISMTYDCLHEIYNKETLVLQVRAITQYLIANSSCILQNALKRTCASKLNTHCEIILSKRQDLDESFAVTDLNRCHIPVKQNGKSLFYLQLENAAIDLITFTEFIQSTWERTWYELVQLKDKEFLQQIIEVSTPQKLVMGLDLDLNIIYQSAAVPSAWMFMEMTVQNMNDYLNFSNIKMEQTYKNMIMNQIAEVKVSKKGAIDAGQIIFFDKSVDLTIYVKKDEENHIKQFYIVFDPPKKRFETQRSSKNNDMKTNELAQQALSVLKEEKIKKACQLLIEQLNLNITTDDIIEQLEEREIINEVQKMEKITQEIRESYVLEYYRTDQPAGSYRRPTAIMDMQPDSPFETKTLLQEQQLMNAKKIDVFSLRQDDTDKLLKWSFDICSNAEQQIHYTWAMFHILNYLDFFQIDKELFFNFLIIVEDRYNYKKNPFHNFEHGFTVAHACFLMIKNKLLDNYLDQTEQFAALLSSLCHDVDHTGRTNGFEVARMSKLAIRYNDDSVLENHHVSTTFKILQKDKYNVLCNLSQEQFQRVRKFMVSNILNTDMKKHFEIISQSELKFKENAQVTSFTDKLLFSGLIVHTCDLAASTKPYPIASKWSKRIQQEFDNQVEEERLLQLPVTQHLVCISLAKQELSFIKAIIKPLYEFTSSLLNKQLQEALDNLEQTQKEWEQQLKK